jgi:anion-transporting  ArsA/GET3 family ATPase
LLSNKLYKYISTSLAGTHEYMAMEKLASLRDDRRFDLIVLDTPPTSNALDFLDAPERLVDALDSNAVRWFVQAFESTGRLSLNLLARSAALVLRGLGRITGRGLLEAMAEFLTDLNDLFGGFRERARAVEQALRSTDVSFLLVTSPAPMAIEEVLFFSKRLQQANMPRGAFIVNRFRVMPASVTAPPTEPQARESILNRGLRLQPDAPSRLVKAHHDAVRLAQLDELHLAKLVKETDHQVPVVRLPELDSDVRGLPVLCRMSELLMHDGV